jgi:hypothetical protein
MALRLWHTTYYHPAAHDDRPSRHLTVTDHDLNMLHYAIAHSSDAFMQGKKVPSTSTFPLGVSDGKTATASYHAASNHRCHCF